MAPLIPKSLTAPLDAAPAALPYALGDQLAAVTQEPLARTPMQDAPAPKPVYAPDPQQQMIDHDAQKLQKVQWHQDHPWGTAENHPGTLGKIAHVLSVAGNIAGNIVAPNVMERIQGTQANLQDQEQGLAKRIDTGTQHEAENKQREATAGNLESETSTRNAELPYVPQKEEAQIGLQNAQTDNLQSPAFQHLETDQGIFAFNPKTKELIPLTYQGQPLNGASKDKAPSKDDHYIANLQKQFEAKGQDPETAYQNAYKQYTKETKVDPGVSRMQVLVNGRGVQVVDPDNPESLIYDRLGHAIQSGAQAPGSIGYQTEKNVTKEFTTGTGAKNITAYNTAIAHLGMLQQAADALHNGDTQAINRIGNEFNKQTGSPAPTNFNAIKDAVAGEVSKTFKGGQATDAEIKQMNESISSAQSPAQLKGVINTFTGLMNSKRDALKQQYQQGLQGKPNFEDHATPPRPANVPEGYIFKDGPKGKGWYRP